MNEYSIKLAKPHCNACGKIKVKAADGTSRFIAKGRATEAINDLAQKSVSSMKERLAGKVVVMDRPDEDI
jgi:hypothetical protein